MKVSFKRDMTHNYMVPELREEARAEDYQIRMLTENHVEGLLSCCLRKINGKDYYFYDITSRQSMEHIYEKEHIRAEDIRMILGGLYRALTEVKKYLLDGNRVMLDPQMIYMDVETKEPKFCYIPCEKGDILRDFGGFAGYILGKLERSDTRAVLLGYEVYRQSMEENYSLEKLLKEIMFQETPHSLEEPKQRIFSEPVRRREQQGEHQGKLSEQPQVGIAQSIEQQNEALLPRAGGTQEKKTIRKKSRGQKPKKKPAKKKIIMALLIPLTVVLAGLGAWFWKLNTTQLGGIAFLLVGILGYGVSVEGKKKKSHGERLREQEKKADKRVRSEEKKEVCQQPLKPPKLPKKLQPSEKEDGPEPIGATQVLWEGEEDYEPHLGLLSMNPRERNSVVLLNESYTIGKLKTRSDIFINHPSISRVHARIQKEGKEYYLCDLNSTNGTFLNGRRLAVNEKVPIHLSDEIRFADLGYYVGKC